MPVEVYGLLNLKTLIISRCSLQYTHDMSSLIKVTNLKLDHNDLEADKISLLPPMLNQLNLSFNHLKSIPSVFDGLVYIVQLDISSNRISSIDGIEQLVALVELNLDENVLTEISAGVASLSKLRRISLRNNKLAKYSVSRPDEQSIPAGLFTDTALDNIDLSGNVDLTKAVVLSFHGVEDFLNRRKALKDKTFAGGALTDTSLFGLD